MKWKDTLAGAWALVSLSLVLGLAVNHIRGLPLPPKQPYSQRTPKVDLAVANRLRANWVDARPTSDYLRGHISGAVSWPGTWPDRAQPTVVYCGGQCGLADTAAVQLRKLGYPQVYVLAGGFEAWRVAGNPVTAGEQP